MRRTGLIIAGCLMSLAFATAAQADTTPLGQRRSSCTSAESSKTCSSPLIENPFARFGDRRNYVMAPDGSFEGAVLTRLAAFGRGQAGDRGRSGRPRGQGRRGDARAAGEGRAAISPTMCVDFHYPSFRLLSKAVSKGEFKIEIIYPDVRQPVWEELKKFDGQQFTNAGSGWQIDRRHRHEARSRRQDRRLPPGGLPLHGAVGHLAHRRPLRRSEPAHLTYH